MILRVCRCVCSYMIIVSSKINLILTDATCRCWKTSRPGTFTNPGTRRSVYSTRPSASSARSTRCRWWTTAKARASTSSGWNRCTSSWINIAVTVSNNCSSAINFATRLKLAFLDNGNRRNFGIFFRSNLKVWSIRTRISFSESRSKKLYFISYLYYMSFYNYILK